ncbi:hypothetical protein PAHAL_6G281500 [Panicum hallii]|uniref:Uncharacterized protein n=1 Tax=Panicum hallii TaxID=206008 RepID=A0A2T8IHX8_9POAL|nr:hypothetical protein PAHAL_6G281500 [Panicum hallii]
MVLILTHLISIQVQRHNMHISEMQWSVQLNYDTQGEKSIFSCLLYCTICSNYHPSILKFLQCFMSTSFVYDLYNSS